jgi:hypothetical protein
MSDAGRALNFASAKLCDACLLYYRHFFNKTPALAGIAGDKWLESRADT